MDHYSIWPFFACVAVLVSVTATPMFRLADSPPSPRGDRIAPLDGLRGFLALAVLFHHVAIYHRYLLDGAWAAPPSRFFTMLGPAGVAMFFMVTGHLFWSRLIQEAGRPNWVHFYTGRLFRIGPLYWAAITAMLLLVLIGTQMTLLSPLPQVLRQIARWSALGLLEGPNVNGFPGTNLLLAGVTWTLQFEWLFYLSLPAIALAARDPRLQAPLTVGALIALVLYLTWFPDPGAMPTTLTCAMLFLCGMACASVGVWIRLPALPDHVASLIVVVAVGLAFAGFRTAYTPGAALLLTVAFYFVASGCTVFGLLVSIPARRLGNISYGIYLLQGLVLVAIFRPRPFRSIALSSASGHWLLALGGGVALIVVATITHAVIERPGIAAGRRVAAFLKPLRGRERAIEA